VSICRETHARAPAFTFFSIKIPLKATFLEEKIYHEVESNQRFAVKEGREKNLKAKPIRLLRLGG
jgi:hypothetical protein